MLRTVNNCRGLQFGKCLMLIFLFISATAKGSSGSSYYSKKICLARSGGLSWHASGPECIKAIFLFLLPELIHSQLGTGSAVLNTLYWGHLPLSPLR